jgi:hypothetical protein
MRLLKKYQAGLARTRIAARRRNSERYRLNEPILLTGMIRNVNPINE